MTAGHVEGGATVRRMLGVASAAMLVVLMAGALRSVRPVEAAGDCTVSASEAGMDAEEQALLSGINAYRSEKGLAPFAPSAVLSRAAAWKSRDMATKGYFNHTDSAGRLPHILNVDCGFSGRVTGENIAAGQGDAATVLKMWKESPAHNQNMLRNFVAAGIGRATGGSYGTYWSLEMGDVVDSGAASVTSTPPPTTTTTTTSTPTTGTTSTTPPQTGTTTTTSTATQTVQFGTVAITVNLVDANGQLASGDRAGYVFSLMGNATFQTPPTNAQGQTTVAIPVGSYTVTQQTRPGSTLRTLVVTGTGAAVANVTAGQTVTVTATNQVATPTPTPTPTSRPTTTASATPTSAAQSSQTGTVSVTVNLVGPNGEAVSGDRSGFVFTLTGGGATANTPPTNVQGQTSMAVTAGVSYMIVAQPHDGPDVSSFTLGSTPVTTVAAAAGQQVTLTAIAKVEPSGTAPTSTNVTNSTRAGAAPAMQSMSLSAGCTNLVLTWKSGTPMSTVVSALSSRDALASIWRYDAAAATFLGYTPAASVASDYVATVTAFDAVFICLNTPATISRPAAG